MDEYRALHRVIRKLAKWAVVSFFTEVHVIGSENVPEDGPLIVCGTHHNMMLDPAVLSTTFPYQRILNYWSKASLFANPVLRYILYSTGNIPVERKSKDRRVLFAGTIDALANGWSVALFPEGTSYTEPRIMQVKDGAAWAALEYTKWARENPDKASKKPVMIIPAAIVYTNKSKYRSDVIVEYGKPISLDAYVDQFFEEAEGSPRAAVKRLTAALQEQLIQSTINAPDWDTLFAARMARDLLWETNKIPLDDFVTVSQTLVDLFSTPNLVPNYNAIKRQLLSYYSLLQSTGLTNDILTELPLDATLDPNKHTPLKLRLRTLAILIKDTLASAIRLPFFAFPLVIHAPVYMMARLGDRLAQDEEETQAQNKVVLGLLSMFAVYPAAFLFLWALLWFSPLGALLAASILYLFANYHNRLINANYLHAKRLFAAWRILLGVWTPKRFDVPLAALAQYTTPFTPAESPWIDRKPAEPTPSGTETPAQTPGALTPGAEDKSKEVKPKRRRKAPTRRLVRHVLRARADAVRALSSLISQLERDGSRSLYASPHLARYFGGRVEKHAMPDGAEGGPTSEQGHRSAHEVLRFLTSKGAKFTGLERESDANHWAALSSGEQTPGVDSEREELTWVPTST